MLRNLPACFWRRNDNAPGYDTFLIHAGEDKFGYASTLKAELDRVAGWHNFIDRDMLNARGAPPQQMRHALQTCRHAVAIVTKVFLTKDHPLQELEYALRRMHCIRGSKTQWESLWVVLGDMTVKEYKTAIGKSPSFSALRRLPHQVVCFEREKFDSWHTLCKKLCAEMTAHDMEGAKSNWKAFMSNHQNTLPATSALYESDDEVSEGRQLKKTLTMITEGGEKVRSRSHIPAHPGFKTCDELDYLGRAFQRVWLPRYIDALKRSRGSAKAYSYRFGEFSPIVLSERSMAHPCNLPQALSVDALAPMAESNEVESVDSQNEWGVDHEGGYKKTEGVLVVYGGPDGEKAWEVQSLYELSVAATTHYSMAILFVTSDRTVGWWLSPDPEYLAVMVVDGIGLRIQGVKGWGIDNMTMVPDALLRGRLELGDNSKIKCRLTHMDNLYHFGSEDSQPTIALLSLSVSAALIAVVVAIEGRAGNDVAVKALAMVLALIGTEYWPGLFHMIRTSFLGAIGGVTGILVSKIQGEALGFVKKIELPILIALPFVCKAQWRVLTCVISMVVVPTYWSSVFRNCAGEGVFWGVPLGKRAFDVADAVYRQRRTDTTEAFLARRPIFTLRGDLDRTSTRLRPAYARGFGMWDLLVWGVGYVPGGPLRKKNVVAWLVASAGIVLLPEVAFAFLSAYILTAYAGLGYFVGCLQMEEADGSGMELSPLERAMGGLSGLLMVLSLCLCFCDAPGAWLFSFVFFFLLAFVLSRLFRLLAHGLSWISLLCFERRMRMAQQARDAAAVEGKNISHTGRWQGLYKCRKKVMATFPRVAGYSYYDGEMVNVHSGWYMPACGRVALSVPRRKVTANAQSLKVETFDTLRKRFPYLIGIEVEVEGTPDFSDMDSGGGHEDEDIDTRSRETDDDEDVEAGSRETDDFAKIGILEDDLDDDPDETAPSSNQSSPLLVFRRRSMRGYGGMDDI